MNREDRLRPVRNAYRQMVSLDGSWWIEQGRSLEALEHGISRNQVIPVPSHIGDVYGDDDMVGTWWLETMLYVPKDWFGQEVYLRFDHIAPRGRVYVNGTEVGKINHAYGPLICQITRQIHYGEENRIVVRIVNELNAAAFPLGEVVGQSIRANRPLLKQSLPVGLIGSVTAYTTPLTRIVDIEASTAEITKDSARIQYRVEVQGNCLVTATLRDRESRVVATSVGGQGSITVPKPQLWDIHEPYLYAIDFEVSRLGKQHDMYRLPFGIRQVSMDKNGQFSLNHKPLVLKAVEMIGSVEGYLTYTPWAAKRELNELVKGGVNAIMTGGLPMPEPLLEAADTLGLLVISELGIGGLHERDLDIHEGDWEEQLLNKRLGESMRSIISTQVHNHRFHPSVIAWSVVTEPCHVTEKMKLGYEGLNRWVRRFDETRPIGLTIDTSQKLLHPEIMKLYQFTILSRPKRWWSEGLAYVESKTYDEIIAYRESYPHLAILLGLGQWSKDKSQSYDKLIHILEPMVAGICEKGVLQSQR